MRGLRVFSLSIAAALALAAAAHAGETGSVSGVVKDSQGGVERVVRVAVVQADLGGGEHVGQLAHEEPRRLERVAGDPAEGEFAEVGVHFSL